MHRRGVVDYSSEPERVAGRCEAMPEIFELALELLP